MYRISEINRRRTGRQGDHTPLWRKDKDFRRAKVVPQGVKKVGDIFSLLLPFMQLLEPDHAGICIRVGWTLLLVLPVRGDTEFSSGMHLGRANLYLDRFAVWSDDRGVERLIEVELRHRDVIFKSTWNWAPSRMDCT